ncbi:hypothetical protein A4X13_0g4927 [Tilletia indica]|uniref:Uncharacterized protein n=1 Tax=Tilletia indica TaxID=43049 RepID=A0A177TXQ7_9BASI|nr:hypothetical protein A4X13_0g4927 [Tilletia indica]
MPRRRGQPAEALDPVALNASFEELKHSGPLPSLFVFDLDYTLWPAWVDTHVDPPLKRRNDDLNKVYDRSGTTLSLYPHVPAILFFLKRNDIPIAIASRTSAPDTAKQALRGLFILDESLPSEERSEPVAAITLCRHMEIYPGSKIRHFKAIQKALGHKYEDMIFYDDEHRNAEVSRELGVHFVEVGNPGTDAGTFIRGVKEWQARSKARQGDPDAGAALL